MLRAALPVKSEPAQLERDGHVRVCDARRSGQPRDAEREAGHDGVGVQHDVVREGLDAGTKGWQRTAVALVIRRRMRIAHGSRSEESLPTGTGPREHGITPDTDPRSDEWSDILAAVREQHGTHGNGPPHRVCEGARVVPADVAVPDAERRPRRTL